MFCNCFIIELKANDRGVYSFKGESKNRFIKGIIKSINSFLAMIIIYNFLIVRKQKKALDNCVHCVEGLLLTVFYSARKIQLNVRKMEVKNC